ncbi:MAG: hypothetical protein QF475_00160 [Candidatus Undinarchaeales archaeon]|nr:hypothetical protein [Candidatus Undinarchaeales archaeon]
MKRMAFTAFAVFFLVLASAVSAGPTDSCSVDKLKVENIATELTTKTKLTYYVECSPTADAGQINRLVVTVPYRDVYNVEAEDALGGMKVFEGPGYAGFTSTDTDSTIGSFFRKAIVLESNNTTGYMMTLGFQSDLMVYEAEKIFRITPSGLGANPKVTAVGTGITEAQISINSVDYSLSLPLGSAVTSSPSGCSVTDGFVNCTGISASVLDSMEIKWTGSGPGVLFTQVREFTYDLPDFFTSFFNGLKSTIDRLLNRD